MKASSTTHGPDDDEDEHDRAHDIEGPQDHEDGDDRSDQAAAPRRTWPGRRARSLAPADQSSGQSGERDGRAEDEGSQQLGAGASSGET